MVPYPTLSNPESSSTPTMRPSLFPLMRRILPMISAAALLSEESLGADSFPPLKMSYQANIVDANGVPIGNTAPENHTIDFTVYDQSNAGPAVYHETQLVTIDKGSFSVLLGDGTVDNTKTYKNLGAVFASPTASDRYVEVTVTLANNVQSTLAPRVRLVTSPYAFLSSQANNSYQATYANVAGSLTNDGSGTTFTTAYVARLDSGQTFSGVCTFNQSITLAAGGRLNEQPLYLRGGGDVNHGLSYGSPAWGIDGAALFGFNGGVLGGTSSGNKRVALSWTGDGKVGINKTGANDTLDVNGGVTATTFTGNGVIPIGGIIIWSGAINAVPSGWALCDGNNGTPNLTDKFVIGAGKSYAKGTTGGSATVTLAAGNLPPHSHNYYDIYYSERNGGGNSPGSSGSDNDNNPYAYQIYRTTENGNGLYSTPFSILPPYYALAYIMRIQ